MTTLRNCRSAAPSRRVRMLLLVVGMALLIAPVNAMGSEVGAERPPIARLAHVEALDQPQLIKIRAVATAHHQVANWWIERGTSPYVLHRASETERVPWSRYGFDRRHVPLVRGPIMSTGGWFDIAIVGPGFFRLQPAALTGDRDADIAASLLTRSGSFKWTDTRRLVNGAGLDVIGFVPDVTGRHPDTSRDSIIEVSAKHTDLLVSPTGEISGVDTVTGYRTTLAWLQVAGVVEPALLSTIAPGLHRATSESGTLQIGLAGTAAFDSTMAVGYLENVHDSHGRPAAPIGVDPAVWQTSRALDATPARASDWFVVVPDASALDGDRRWITRRGDFRFDPSTCTLVTWHGWLVLGIDDAPIRHASCGTRHEIRADGSVHTHGSVQATDYEAAMSASKAGTLALVQLRHEHQLGDGMFHEVDRGQLSPAADSDDRVLAGTLIPGFEHPAGLTGYVDHVPGATRTCVRVVIETEDGRARSDVECVAAPSRTDAAQPPQPVPTASQILMPAQPDASMPPAPFTSAPSLPGQGESTGQPSAPPGPHVVTSNAAPASPGEALPSPAAPRPPADAASIGSQHAARARFTWRPAPLALRGSSAARRLAIVGACRQRCRLRVWLRQDGRVVGTASITLRADRDTTFVVPMSRRWAPGATEVRVRAEFSDGRTAVRTRTLQLGR